MRKVPAPKVVTAIEATESPLPAEIREALGELVGAAREGLLALSVGVGLGVVHELMGLEVTEVVGPKGKHDPDHRAARQDAVLDEPVREHDRDRPLHPAQRQTLARRRHAQALDRRRHAPSRQQFRRIIGYRDLAKLVIAIERHANLIAHNKPDRPEIARPVTV
jgi:hypothetical protein